MQIQLVSCCRWSMRICAQSPCDFTWWIYHAWTYPKQRATSLTPRKLQTATVDFQQPRNYIQQLLSEPAESGARCQYNSQPNLSREQIHLSPLDAFFRRHTVHSSSKRRTWFASPPSGVRSAGESKTVARRPKFRKFCRLFSPLFQLARGNGAPVSGPHFRLIDCKMDRPPLLWVVPCQELRCKLRQ